MDQSRSLNSAIADQCAAHSARGAEFDVDDIVTAVMADDSLWQADAARLARHYIRKLVTGRLKADSGQDMAEAYPQLALAGFEHVPANVPFYSGNKVRYIAALSATRAHLVAAIKLRDDNIRFCEARRKEYRQMLDLIDASGTTTFGEALVVEVRAA